MAVNYPYYQQFGPPQTSQVSANTATNQARPKGRQTKRKMGSADQFQSSNQAQATPNKPNTGRRRKANPIPVTHPAPPFYQEPPISPETLASYNTFLTRLRLVNNSERAEYNFGKPESLHGNPFRAHWEDLDRQRELLQSQINEFLTTFPGTTVTDYINRYNDFYQLQANAGLAKYLEKPHAMSTQIEWMSKMVAKQQGPREPLSGIWDLLHPDYQDLLIKVGNFKAANPRATSQDYVHAYNQEYTALCSIRHNPSLEAPHELAKRLEWVEGLLKHASIRP